AVYGVYARCRRASRSPLFPYTTLFRSASNRVFGEWRDFRARLVLPVRFGSQRKERAHRHRPGRARRLRRYAAAQSLAREEGRSRSEEHTSELQSPYDLVCRLLLEKKKQ